jgi:DNA-binding YbaB/EbfC family protein
MFGKAGMGQLMKQAQAMQEKAQKLQAEVAQMTAEGEAGGGLVKVTLTGKHEATKVVIDPSLMDDREMLEDLVTAAINSANRKVEQMTNEKMGSLTAGMNMPAGMGNLFG